MNCTAGKRCHEDSLELRHLFDNNDDNRPLHSNTRAPSLVQHAEAGQLAQNKRTHEQHSVSARYW